MDLIANNDSKSWLRSRTRRVSNLTKHSKVLPCSDSTSLAAQVRYGASYLDRPFQYEIGITPLAYLRERRL